MSAKIIKIGGKEVGFTANGATPPLFNMVFPGADFFNLFAGEIKPADVPRLAFVMATQYSAGEEAAMKKTAGDFLKFTAQFPPLALEAAAAEIVGVLTDSMATSSDPKPAAG